MKYTFRQLEVFLACAHYQNVTHAAKALAMSQSAASGALKELESQFNVQLFDRVGKRLQINELGLRLRPRVEALMDRANELETELTEHTRVGHIKVGATLTIGNYLAVSIIHRYMAQGRGATVALEVANTANIVEKILNYDLDIGLIEGEFYHPDLISTPWLNDELVCFACPQHPLAQSQSLTDQDLVNAEWILRERGSGTRQTFDRAMQGLLPNLKIALELQHTEAIKRATEANLGISCLSHITLSEAFKHGTLTPLNVKKNFSRKFYHLVHREKYQGAGITQWIALCDATVSPNRLFK